MKGITDHLGHDKFFYTIDIKWIFNFFNYLDNLMTQCFTSFRMSNLRYALII